MSRRSRYRPRVRRKRAYFPRRASAARHLKNFSARLERAIAKELTYICLQYELGMTSYLKLHYEES